MRAKRRISWILCVAILLGFVPFSYSAKEITTVTPVKAAETTSTGAISYYFSDGTNKVQIGTTGGVYEAKNNYNQTVTMYLYKTEGGVETKIASGVSITFEEGCLSPDNKVVQVVRDTDTGGEILQSQFRMKINGPGYQAVSGQVKVEDGGFYTFAFWVHVPLEINRTPTGLSEQTEERYFAYHAGDQAAAYSLELLNPTIRHQVKIVSFTALNLAGEYDYSKLDLDWIMSVQGDEENRRVATISNDGQGIITAVGAGAADLKISTRSSDMAQIDTENLRIVIPLHFSKTQANITATGSATETTSQAIYKQFKSEITGEAATDGSITIYSTAYDPVKDMTWKITDSKGKDVSSWFDISAVNMGDFDNRCSSITIKGSKAGVYTLVGYVNSIDPAVQYSHAKLTLTVPAYYGNKEVWMNVKDKYNIYNNTNIPDPKNFAYASDNIIVASVNSNGVITAKRNGTTMVYAYPKEYDNVGGPTAAKAAGECIEVTVHVVDTIALSTEEATLSLGGKLELVAQTSDVSREIVWTVEDPKILSIEEDGGVEAVVTALKTGETIVTATQTIGGVEKSASCLVTVISDISKITVTPETTEIDIGEYAVLKATLAPKLAANTVIHWVSSDEKIVALENPLNKSTTCSIFGVSAGKAVVMAINQSNIVVGSCMVTVLRAPDGLTLSQKQVTVPRSQDEYQLRATINPKDATNQKIKWTSSNTKVATVDDNGLVTFVKAGTVTIIAQSTANPSIQDMCEMTILEAVTALTLDDKTVTLEAGKTFRLSYHVSPETAYDRSVTFTTMDSKIATVNSTGLITAKKPGTTYITVKTVDGGFSQVCTVTVKQAATAFKLDATGLVLDVGENYYLQSTFTPKTTTEVNLRYSSNDTSVAKVDSKGCVTAIGAGECIITVTTSNNITAFVYVTVNQPVEGVELDYEDAEVDKGDTLELVASIIPDNATNQELKWKSSNEAVAKVDKDGVVKGVSGGHALITVTTEEGGFQAICLVKVIEKVVNIKLNKRTYKLGLGKKFTLTAKVTNAAASDQTVTWVSSNPEICSVNEKGVIQGLKLGRATVTAYANDGSEAEASCEVRVINQATSISVNTSMLNMVVGDSEVIKATLKPDNITFKKPKFVSDNTDIAFVDASGKVTAVAPGTCKITTRPKDNSGLKAITVVNVRAIVAATGITLSPSDLTMGVGGTDTIIAALKPSNSTDRLTWSSNNKAVVRVGKSTGVVKAIAPGVATITATASGGKSATVKVTVVGLNYSSITLEQYDPTFQLRVIGATTGVVWDVDDPSICTVKAGRVSAKKEGTTYVVARVSGAELRCKVTVTNMK